MKNLLKLANLNRSLALIQLLTILLFIADAFATVNYQRWSGDRYFEPLLSYAPSLQATLLPAIVVLMSYVIAILTGIPIPNIPRKVIEFIRNKILQSYTWMLPFIFLSLVFVSYVGWKTMRHSPPYYEKIVNKILDGENDNFKISIADLQSIDPHVATQFSNVISVFEERLKFSAGEKSASAAQINLLIRKLDSNITDEWRNHPLRLHALAEAKLLLGQAIISDPDINLDNSDSLFDQAVNLYKQVSQSTSPLATRSLRTSAKQNLGNIYLYRKDFSNAEKIYRSMINGNKTLNLATRGNLIISLYHLGKFDEAIEQGLIAKELAKENQKKSNETQPFVHASILENTAFAYWGKGEFKQAHKMIKNARAYRDDDLNTANLAMSYRFLGKTKEAKRIMRLVAEPADAGSAESLAGNPEAEICNYLIWAAIFSGDNPILKLANLGVFLSDPIKKSRLEETDSTLHKDIVKRAWTRLEKLHAPCYSFWRLPVFAELLGVNYGTSYMHK